MVRLLRVTVVREPPESSMASTRLAWLPSMVSPPLVVVVVVVPLVPLVPLLPLLPLPLPMELPLELPELPLEPPLLQHGGKRERR